MYTSTKVLAYPTKTIQNTTTPMCLCSLEYIYTGVAVLVVLFVEKTPVLREKIKLKTTINKNGFLPVFIAKITKLLIASHYIRKKM